MAMNIPKRTTVFYESDSNKALVLKLNEYVMATEKRISDLEKKVEETGEKIVDLEIKL